MTKKVVMMQSGYGVRWKRTLCAALCAILCAAPLSPASAVSLYDAVAVDETASIHAELLAEVCNAESAWEAVSRQANAMTEEQKRNPADINQAALFAEEAVAAAVKRKTDAPVIVVSAETLSPFIATAAEVRDGAAKALAENGVSVTRKIASTVTLETDAPAFTILICSNMLDTKADKVRITSSAPPGFSVTFRPADFSAELRPDPENPEPRTLSIGVELSAGECEPGTGVPVPQVKITAPDGQLSAPVTLSMNPGSNEPSSLAMKSASGEAAVSRYNPASRTLDARLDSSDVYTFGKRNIYFTDLLEKDRKIRTAVEALARVNVVYGYSDHTFRPEQAVTRAEFVAFVMRVLGRVNNSLKSPFEDVTEAHGCYHEIASAYYYGIVRGYDETHFCGDILISKTQIYAILGRILEREMGYWPPENPQECLAEEFTDAVDEWAQAEVALAVREGLVIRQSDGAFAGQQMMSRGDVALIIYGLYQRLA